MRTIHLRAGTGLRYITCQMSELDEKFNKPYFTIETFGWGVRGAKIGSRVSEAENYRVRLIFDTRYIDNLSLECEATYHIGENFQIVLYPARQPVSSALVVDLGNTRSFSLILDDIGHAQSMQIHQLQICAYSRWTDDVNKTGVFASNVCLEHLHPVEHSSMTESEERCGRPLSVVRTGAAARALTLRIAKFPQDSFGRVAQVSPKRFFWDHDPVRFKWRAGCVNDNKCVEPKGILYDLWLKDKNISAESMPPSTLIGAMVVELYSQAEMQLNDQVAGQTADGPRRIHHVAITYPPAWTKLEKEAYRQTIACHLFDFCDERGLPHPNVSLECDEATGTLLAYISNEVEKFGGALSDWVAGIGSTDGAGNCQARIAVLDVGGGTSDLVMADVSVFKGRFGVEHLQINRFHQDGILVAGDELLRKVATRIVLPAVAKAICPPDADDARVTFFNFAVSQVTNDEVIKSMRSRWAQQVWFPLALHVMQTWGNKVKINFSQDSDLNKGLDAFCEDCLEMFQHLQVQRIGFTGLGVKDEANNGAIAKYLGGLKPDSHKIAEICEEVFSDAAARFGIPIALAGCDRVLLAGKTTDFSNVRDVLTKAIPLPKFKIVSFENYRLSSRWMSSAGKDGSDILGDVKMTTVIGAALELCVKNGIDVFGLMSNLEITDAHLFSDSQQYWGIVPSTAAVPVFRNRDAVFKPGDGLQREQIPMHCQSLLVARRRTKLENMTAQIAYELRVHPRFNAIANGVVEIERALNSDGSVELVLSRVVSGTLDYADRVQVHLRKEHLELRQMVAQNSEFWISEGNMHEQIQW